MRRVRQNSSINLRNRYRVRRVHSLRLFFSKSVISVETSKAKEFGNLKPNLDDFHLKEFCFNKKFSILRFFYNFFKDVIKSMLV